MMNRTSEVRVRFAAVLTLGLTVGGIHARPAQGDVAFAPADLYPVGDVPIGVTVADVDGNGALDVISANGELSLLVNNGDGTLATEVRLNAGGGDPRSVAVGDLDDDGTADLVASIRSGPGTIAVFLAESAGEFAPAVQYGTGNFSFAMVMDDLDNDDDLDIAVAMSDDLGAGVSVFRNTGDGTFLPAEAYNAFQADIIYTADLAAGDVNGDGLTDLVVVNDCAFGSCSSTVALLINAGDGTFLPPVPVDLGVDISAGVRADDFDGDGDVDLAIVECVALGSDLVIAVNDGLGAFSIHSRSSTGRFCTAGSVSTPEGIAILDVDADGAPDAVLANMLDSEVMVLRNRGDLTFEPPLAFAVGERPIAVAVGDLDGDGHADMATADRAIGGTTTVTVLINQTPTAHGDINGDGNVDIIDYALFEGCMAGPDVTTPPPGCDPSDFAASDLEGDNDVDFTDFAGLGLAFGN